MQMPNVAMVESVGRGRGREVVCQPVGDSWAHASSV